MLAEKLELVTLKNFDYKSEVKLVPGSTESLLNMSKVE